jgi:Xaa-Pro aminopeptidase
MLKNRAGKADEIIKKHGLDAMLFTDMNNIRYLSGFTGTDGVLIVSAKETCFLTDSRYITQAEKQVQCQRREYKQKISDIAGYLNSEVCAGKVGIEGHDLSIATFNELRFKCNDAIELLTVSDSNSIRSIKDNNELTQIEKSAAISCQAMESIIEKIQPGVTEREIALELEIATLRFGSEVKAFDFIVASGVRGAMPHGIASDKVLQEGELITVDFGSCFNGYYSDETINFALGEIDQELYEIHDIVLKAHDIAIDSIKPGVFLSEIDKNARDFIRDKGYGANFGHGLGHGVGLEVHEYPRVSPLANKQAEVGMVFTVEPGIYMPGLGGVRIEDMVVVTETGSRCLTRLPKNLRQLIN